MKDNYYFYKEKLNKDYLEAFETVELYCSTNQLASEDSDELLMDLMDLFLDAQNNNRPVESIVGKDMKSFCKNVCERPDLRTQLWLLMNTIKRVSWFMLFVGAIELISFWMHANGQTLWKAESNIMAITAGLGVGCIVCRVVSGIGKKVMFHTKRFSMKMYNSILIVSVLGVSYILIRMIDEGVVINVPIIVQCIACVVYLCFFYIASLVFYKDKISRRREAKKHKVHYTDHVKAQIPQKFIEVYEKKNAKRIQRGQEPISKDDYTKSYTRWMKLEAIYLKLYWLLPLMFIVIGVYDTSRNSGLLDTSISAVVCTIIMIPVFLCLRSLKTIITWRHESIAACMERGQNLIDYMEELAMEEND